MFKQNCVADLTKEPESIDCDILLRSIGYQADPMPEIHFDYRNSIIPNSYGCVIAEVISSSVDSISNNLGKSSKCRSRTLCDWLDQNRFTINFISFLNKHVGPIGVLDTTLKDSVVYKEKYVTD